MYMHEFVYFCHKIGTSFYEGRYSFAEAKVIYFFIRLSNHYELNSSGIYVVCKIINHVVSFLHSLLRPPLLVHFIRSLKGKVSYILKTVTEQQQNMDISENSPHLSF